MKGFTDRYWVWCSHCGVIQPEPEGVCKVLAERIEREHTNCGVVDIQPLYEYEEGVDI